jgi:hypothetical protein
LSCRDVSYEFYEVEINLVGQRFKHEPALEQLVTDLGESNHPYVGCCLSARVAVLETLGLLV